MAARDQNPWSAEFDPQPQSIEQAIIQAGLDWEVLSKPAYYLDSAVDTHTGDAVDLEDADTYDEDDVMLAVNRVANYYVNVRSDNGLPIGVVTKRYSPFHNLQAFAFLGQIFGSEMDFVAAGDFMNSRRVWVLMRLPDFVEIGGEQVGQYAFVHTSHDGKHSVTVSMTPFLVKSKTLLTTEVRRARNYNAKRTIALRHVGDMDDKVAQIQNAQLTMDVSVNYYKQFLDMGDKMATTTCTEQDAATMAEALLPIDEEKDGERAQANTVAARDEIVKLYKAAGTDSWWAAYTAAVEFADWVRPERKKDGRFQRAIDDPDGFKNQAFELALGGAGL